MAMTTRYGIDVTAYDEGWNVSASMPSADYFSEDEAIAVAEEWAETLDRCRVKVIEMRQVDGGWTHETIFDHDDSWTSPDARRKRRKTS